MPDSDSSLKNIDYFRKKMEKQEDCIAMRLPRSFAQKAEQLFGKDPSFLKKTDFSDPTTDGSSKFKPPT